MSNTSAEYLHSSQAEGTADHCASETILACICDCGRLKKDLNLA